MSPMVRTRHGEVTAELAWSSSGSRSEITPAVGRTVHLPPPPPIRFINAKPAKCSIKCLRKQIYGIVCNL
ncbi:hypothetical protein Hanom_Chr08g00704741 [Helianthus anomalus]